MDGVSILLNLVAVSFAASVAVGAPVDTGVPVRDFIAEHDALKVERFVDEPASREAWSALRDLHRPERFDEIMRSAYDEALRDIQEQGSHHPSFVAPSFAVVRGWLLPWPPGLGPPSPADDDESRLLAGTIALGLPAFLDEVRRPEWRQAVCGFASFDRVFFPTPDVESLLEVRSPQLTDGRPNALIDAFVMRHSECADIRFESLRATFAMARMCGSEPFFLWALIMYAIEVEASKGVFDVIDTVDHPGIDPVAWLDVVRRHHGSRPGLDWYMGGELLASLDAVDAVFRSRPSARLLGHAGDAPPEGATHAEINAVVKRLHDERLRAIRNTRQDRRNFVDLLQDLIESADPSARDLVWTILPRMSHIMFNRFDEADAHLHGAITALALVAYRQDHGGAWPGSLEELVPEYLDALPEDPFAQIAGEPLVYRVDGEGTVWLYSRGFDLTDNGGVRASDPRDRGPGHDLVFLPRGD